MTSVNVTSTATTVIVEDDGAKVVVTTGDVSTAEFVALQSRVTIIEESFDGGTY